VSETLFRDLYQQVSKLYYARDYSQAFELVEKEQTAFPEDADEIASLRL
jgi:hypothetical protein